MPKRTLPAHQVCHVFNRSIAQYKIFYSYEDFCRMKETMRFYMATKRPCKFSLYNWRQQRELPSRVELDLSERMVNILAYCIMPTHIHFVLEPLVEEGISNYMRCVLLSYAKYFNVKYKRKGHLWESYFKSVYVECDEQLLHLTRYIHLNPTSSN